MQDFLPSKAIKRRTLVTMIVIAILGVLSIGCVIYSWEPNSIELSRSLSLFVMMLILSGLTVTGTVLLLQSRQKAILHSLLVKERELREQDFWLQNCQRVGRIGSYDLDIVKGTYTSSDTLDDILGMAHDAEKTVATWNAAVHPEHREEMLSYFFNHVVGKKLPFDRQYRIQRLSDGKARWVWGHGELQYGPDGSPIRMVGTIQDIDDRKRAELDLHESKAQVKSSEEQVRILSRSVDQSSNTVMLANRLGDIQYVNPKFTAVTGYTMEEVIGKNPRFLKSGKTPPETYDKLWKAISSGNEWRGEIQNRKKNGEMFWEAISISPLTDDQGEITHFLAIKEDVTERRHLERQLLQAQKLESIGTLAGGIAHDFNNLLSIILSSAELLQLKLKEAPELKKYVQAIIDSSQRGTSISRQLLMFSRPDASEMKPISLSYTLGEVEKLLNHFLPKPIEVRVSIEARNNLIMADAGQIHQAVLNLALNAGDAMPKKGVLTIREYSVEPEEVRQRFGYEGTDNFVAVSVADNGSGIPPELLSKIFDPFFTTKEKGKGTGLGLSIVHGIVKNHHGFLDVQSALGQGTTFIMYFPIVEQDMSEEPRIGAGQAVTRQGTIMIVDDEVIIREMISEFLLMTGYSTMVVSNGPEALAMYRANRADIILVITDLGMPQMSGEEFFSKLRDIDPDVAVIASSGYLDGTTKHDLKTMGFRDILTKPFLMGDLERTVRSVLEGDSR